MVDTKPTIDLDFAYDEDSQTLEEALRDFYFAIGVYGRVTHEVIEEHGPGGGHPLIRFTAADQDALYELGTGYGLEHDDPRLSPLYDGPCPHPTISSHEGVWTCEDCGEDRTEESMSGLLDTVVEILQKAEGVGPREKAIRIREANIWFGSANAAAVVVLTRTNPWLPNNPNV